MLSTLDRECIKIDNIHTLDLDITLDCGQCFRWEKESDGRWHGIAFGKELWVKCENGTFELYNTCLLYTSRCVSETEPKQAIKSKAAI